MHFLPFTRPMIDEPTINSVGDVLRSGRITSGPRVMEFEGALSRYLSGRRIRAVSHGTAALEIALAACGIGPGDEVIVPALSFVASANAIVRVGARPIFVDVDLETRNIDLDQAVDAINRRTRAILPVHFAGLPVDMHRVLELARRNGLRVIEDAAHAIGSSFLGKRIGSFGDLTCFSFHANKNLTTIEGGAIAAEAERDIEVIERLRFHGLVKRSAEEFEVEEVSGKANLPDVNAAIGLGQLPHLDTFNAVRRQIAEHYFERLGTHCPLRLPARAEGHSWHIFAPLLPVIERNVRRADFIRFMGVRGIGVGVHYPAIHRFEAYRRLGYREGQFPNAERIGRETITLPLFPAMTPEDVDRVVSAALACIEEART